MTKKVFNTIETIVKTGANKWCEYIWRDNEIMHRTYGIPNCEGCPLMFKPYNNTKSYMTRCILMYKNFDIKQDMDADLLELSMDEQDPIIRKICKDYINSEKNIKLIRKL